MSQDDQFGQPRDQQPPPGGPWQQPEPPAGAPWQGPDQTQQIPAYAPGPPYGGAAGDPYGQQPGWGQQPYGGSDGGQPGYPPQPWQQQPAQPQGTNTLAILGFVFAFVLAPVGIVLSALGLRQTRQRNEGGHGLALAGLILSIVFTVFGVLGLVLLAAAGDDVADVSGSAPAPLSAAAPSSSTGALPLPADPSSGSGSDPGSTAPAGSVSAACDTILPTITDAEDELSSATSEQEALQKLEEISQQLDTAAAGTDDADFQADVTRVTDAYRSLGRAAAAGQTPDFQELAEAASDLGTDCALAGVTD